MRDERPGDAEYARIALQRPVGQLGQLPVEAAGKVVADFANLFFDYMEIIDQPLGGRCDRAFLADRGCDRSIGIEQDPAVLPQPRGQPPPGLRLRGYRLRRPKALGVLLEALGAEQFGANQLLVRRIGSLEEFDERPKDRILQFCPFGKELVPRLKKRSAVSVAAAATSAAARVDRLIG